MLLLRRSRIVVQNRESTFNGNTEEKPICDGAYNR